MPEGHTIHRLARDQRPLFVGKKLRISTIMERFAESAALLDGRRLSGIDAHGKHLFYDFGDDVLLHVHLGLYGRVRSGEEPAPEPVGALRVRMETKASWLDLRGPAACDIVAPEERDAILRRLGPDPLRSDADPDRAYARIAKSRVSLAQLFMDQSVIAGIGNIYRAEILYRHAIDPFAPGTSLARSVFDAAWPDLAKLMRSGVRAGRIVTTDPADRLRAGGRVSRSDSFYVYHRTGEPCRRCGAIVVSALVAGRTLYYCPREQHG